MAWVGAAALVGAVLVPTPPSVSPGPVPYPDSCVVPIRSVPAPSTCDPGRQRRAPVSCVVPVTWRDPAAPQPTCPGFDPDPDSHVVPVLPSR